MTNDPAPPARRRRTRTTTPKETEAAAEAVPEAEVAPPSAAMAVTPSIPRSIFSSPLTASRIPAVPPAPIAPAVVEQTALESAQIAATESEPPAAAQPVRARGRTKKKASEASPEAGEAVDATAASRAPGAETEAPLAASPRPRRARPARSNAPEPEQSEGGTPAPPEAESAAAEFGGGAVLEHAPAAATGADEEWLAAPASDDDLIAIARATGTGSGGDRGTARVDSEAVEPFPVDEEMVTWEPAGDPEAVSPAESESTDGAGADEAVAPRRRRRRGRGRRGGAGRNGAPVAAEDNEEEVTEPGTPDLAPSARPESRQPILPDYPVEFEPTPPPTKRRPSRRPGMTSDPRFSREEQAEIDRFVGTRPSAAPSPPAEPDLMRASLLTAEEEEELARAAPLKGRQRRGRGAKATETPTAGGTELTPTPAFEPLPPSTRARAGQNALEALLGRQNIILDTLMERQIALLRNIERSLIAMDRRLSEGTPGFTNLSRAGVFVDVPNVVYAAERIGCNIDFGKLLALLTRGRELVRASAYAPVSDDPQMRLESQKFVQPFVGRGYRIVTKPLKRFSDGSMKGNFDVELAMDILTMADRLDVVCLVSGDGDFSRLVEIIASKGVRVEVVAFSASTSSELKATCDEYIDLGTRLREICS